MVDGIRTISPGKLNKVFGSNFRIDTRVQQETPEEGRRMNRSKRCVYSNKDEDNSPYTLNDENYQASSHTFRRRIISV